MLLGQQVRAYIRNDWDATPIHVTRDPLIMQVRTQMYATLEHVQAYQFISQELVEHSADVNSTDIDGNTPLHHLCMDEKNKTTTPDCISILVSSMSPLNP